MDQSSSSPVPTQANHQSKSIDRTQTLKLTGTILYKNLEGGFYAFDADNGKKYTLSGLDKSMLKHGLRLQVTATTQPDTYTIHQYGLPLKVISAKIIGQARVKDDRL